MEKILSHTLTPMSELESLANSPLAQIIQSNVVISGPVVTLYAKKQLLDLTTEKYYKYGVLIYPGEIDTKKLGLFKHNNLYLAPDNIVLVHYSDMKIYSGFVLQPDLGHVTKLDSTLLSYTNTKPQVWLSNTLELELNDKQNLQLAAAAFSPSHVMSTLQSYLKAGIKISHNSLMHAEIIAASTIGSTRLNPATNHQLGDCTDWKSVLLQTPLTYGLL